MSTLRITASGLRRWLPIGMLIAWLTMVCTGCNHRDFLYEEPYKRVQVEVAFDWSADPQAMPGGMTVYFFRIGSKKSPAAYDMRGREGAVVSLMPGTYRAIAHNNDSDRHGFSNYDNFDEFGIRLNDHRNSGTVNSSSSGLRYSASDERLAHSPDSMWVAVLPEFEIAADGAILDGRRTATLTFEMQPVVHHYTFRIHNPINFNSSLSVTATLSGMASTVHPTRGVSGDETVTHLFDMVSTADGGLFGEILTFGHCSGRAITARSGDDDGDDDRPHLLVVQAQLGDGTRWVSSHDVTDQIHGNHTWDCNISLDSIAFPAAGGGTGFMPAVGGWTGSSEIVDM